MPVKIQSIHYENGKLLRKPKFYIKCYERNGRIERVYKTIEEIQQALQHYTRNEHKLPCNRSCPFCIEVAKEGRMTTKKGKKV